MEEAEQHINFLELKAAILALKAFLRIGMQPPVQSLGHHPQHHILLEIDNTNAVAYVNRRGDSVTIYVPTDLGTVVLPADPRFMDDRTQLRGNPTCAQGGYFGRMSSGHSTSLLCSGGRLVRVAFEPSAASLCVATSRPRGYSGGCL